MRQAISVKQVNTWLGGAQVLHDITLDLPAGRWTSIVGPNGAGKSTLLKVMAGLLPVARGGRVSLFNQPLISVPARQRAQALAWL
ncbi:MAG: hypothetical protein RLZZ401_969, partial [Pseudomonadota bacterium]